MASEDRSTGKSGVSTNIADGGGNTAADVRGELTDLWDSAATQKDENTFEAAQNVPSVPTSEKPVDVRHSDYDGRNFNQVVSDTSGQGDRTILLDEGTITFNGSIDPSGTVVVQGRGKNQTILKSNGSDRFYNTFSDNPGASLVLKDLTLDMNGVATDGRVINLGGTRDHIWFHNVIIKNVNLANQGFSRGFIALGAGDPTITSFMFTGESELRWDTITNRQSHDYAFVRSSTGNTLERLGVGPNTLHVGDATNFLSTPYMRGYEVGVVDRAVVDGYFVDWEQYATFIQGQRAHTLMEVRAHAENIGNGDCFRVASIVSGGGIARLHGSVSGAQDDGDRAFIVQSAEAVGIVDVDITVIDGSLVPLHIRGGSNISGKVTVRNSGKFGAADPGSSSYRPAVMVRDDFNVINSLHLVVDILNDDPERWMDPAIEIDEVNGNWDAATHIIEGTARGYEASQVEDTTDAGTTIDTARLFG